MPMSATTMYSCLPLIDIRGLRSNNLSDRMSVASELREACQRCGFFYIINHGIDPVLIRAVQEQSERFFALPDSAKMAVDKAFSLCNRGYEPLRAQTLEAGSPPDLKEGFYIGIDLKENDPRVVAGRFNQGPNQWPVGVADFRSVMEAYFAAAFEVSALLMRGLALSLDLAEDYFAPLMVDASATLRLLHYPPQPPKPQPGEKGCGAHTDFGALTLLLQDNVGGLQVKAIDSDQWIEAPPIEGSYVVNLGDMINRWTNDRYHSNVHRVINLSGRERYSVPFFFTGNMNTLVECLPTCLGSAGIAKYPPVTIEQHFMERYQASYGGCI
ncbi:isopenicillin N synthase family oxygenase [Pseudomonas fluorescens]|uniref:isopenicillin N synthase family dioxygenase n=1 Tax=Pseudomonas fluorescens TaxID=294 RepID=UPI0019A928C5|nr:2-oxoglutarate and iron-dependent oxygenase domain-containing protein [Pseudomonas fluorescens]MBD8094598.1 isopenicillin N synthase family oxygenase [Pseudomonas fluorescens]MBD8720491.1 isopenicillin N synthase family oxygenase [Pseudomonas fluorescens]